MELNIDAQGIESLKIFLSYQMEESDLERQERVAREIITGL